MILSKVRDVDDGSPSDEDVSDYENKKNRKRARTGDFDDEISTSSDDHSTEISEDDVDRDDNVRR